MAIGILLVLPALVVGSGGDEQQKALKQLEGTWKVEFYTVGGEKQLADKGPKEFKITGSQMTGLGPPMKLMLDPSKKPKWMTMTFERGGKEFPLRAIYELDGETLRISFGMAQIGKPFKNERPTSFDSKDELVAVISAKREKEEKK